MKERMSWGVYQACASALRVQENQRDWGLEGVEFRGVGFRGSGEEECVTRGGWGQPDDAEPMGCLGRMLFLILKVVGRPRRVLSHMSRGVFGGLE